MKTFNDLLLLICFSVSVQVFAHGNNQESSTMMSGLDTPAAKAVNAFHLALESGNKELARKWLADNVIIFEGGNVERSADQYASHHMLSDMKYSAAVNKEILEHQVRLMGDTAISTSRNHIKGTFKGKDRDYEGMETIVLEKQNGKWKIVHIHWSH